MFEKRLLRPIVHWRLARFERRYRYDMSYARELFELSPRAFLQFSKLFGLAAFAQDLPPALLYAAKFAATRHEDCGPCSQLMLDMALQAGVPRPALQALLQRPVRIGNDCQCFALSEALGGAADGFPSMFGAILGTGAGGGFCVNGRLLAGYNGMAGEWGHLSLPASLLARHRLPLWDCPCGLQGCLERYVSGSGLEALYRHLGGAALDTAQIAQRAAAGEGGARLCLDIHLDLLAHGLAQLMLALDPHAFVLGGGLSKLAHLYTELPAAMARHLFKGVRVPPILPPHFGDAGGARGAALLALQSQHR